MGNISTSVKTVAADAGKTGEGVRPTPPRDFASSNEKQVEALKAKPKTKRIILGAVLIAIVAMFAVNLISFGSNARFCTNCGYSGSMKAVTLTAGPFLDAVVKLLVSLFPVLLYYYAERGRFICPKCGRTSANVTVKRRLRELER